MENAKVTKGNVVVLLGWPARSSLSPPMHEAGFRALGLDWSYVPLDVPPGGLSALKSLLGSPSVVGANVTIPHKEAALTLVDALTPMARAAGALNTIVKTDGSILGDNTDGVGLVRALAAKGKAPDGCKAVLFGAGGAARGVACALAEAGAREIVILNRSQDRAVRLAEVALTASGGRTVVETRPWFCADEPDILMGAMNGADIVVNATPVTHDPNSSPVPDALLDALSPAQGCVVCDMVYRPNATRLLLQGLSIGLRTVSGLEILFHQAIPAFEAWTGHSAPARAMALALRAAAEAVDPTGGEWLECNSVLDRG